VFMFVTVNKT